VTDGNATCQNRYPEIITNSDGSKTLMGFVATGKQLFPDFAPDLNNNYCGQCYELEFYKETLNDKTDITNAIVQVTNTGDANGLFDFEVPGGGFGANNGCTNYSSWQVYTSQNGPCDSKSTCTVSGDKIKGCAVYGGFQNISYCNSAFGTDTEAKDACNNILFGVFKERDQIPAFKGHCPGFPDNLKIKRYRPIKCPDWHTSKTGSSKAPLAQRAKINGDKCNEDSECQSRNCHNNICSIGNIQNGSVCTYNKECQSKYCQEGKCSDRSQGNICYYNDACFQNINKNLSNDVNIRNLKQNCSTPDDYCNQCKASQIGMGNIFYEFDKNQKWNDIFTTDDQFKTFFESPSGVTCPYLPNKYPTTCDRLNKQCGGSSGGGSSGADPWDGPTYCGKNKTEKTNCECIKHNDAYSQCQLKTN